MRKINDILVVDDDAALVDYVVGALREAGYAACAAYDGESALFAIETVSPGLVLLDLHLPSLSGVDVVEQLRRHDLADVPVVLMTGDTIAVEQLPAAEFPEYLIKPFDLDTLLAYIRRYVGPQHRRAQAPARQPPSFIGIGNR